jgi:hypothetical protein
VRTWLRLIHQLPSKPDYLRVKTWRRLQRIGAVAIKSSVYALPRSEQAMEHFQWMVREIVAAGGEASVCEAAFVDGLSDGQVEAFFHAARGAEYAALADEAGDLLRALPAGRALDPERRGEVESSVSRLRRRLDETVAIDFFGAPSRDMAEDALRRLEQRMTTKPKSKIARPAGGGRGRRTGQTWVTRQGVYIDRIASAWLIRRFIDPRAKFRYVDEKSYRPGRGEIRFDMFEGEYTHEGDQCTFEVLLDRVASKDPALRAIAEIIHDVDLKDNKFGRDEAVGIRTLIDGIALTTPDDLERIARGTEVFNNLYEVFGKKRQ